MIQRTLLRHSRALASCRPAAPRSSLIRSQFRPANAAFAPLSRQVPATRFYATEPEAKAEGKAAAAEENVKENGEKNGAEEAEDPVKKELEAKNKEIIDLKVCAR
jgi:molecular chaperone GrpE